MSKASYSYSKDNIIFVIQDTDYLFTAIFRKSIEIYIQCPIRGPIPNCLNRWMDSWL